MSKKDFDFLSDDFHDSVQNNIKNETMKDKYIEQLECLLAQSYDVLDELRLPSKFQPSGLKEETNQLMDKIKELNLHIKNY